MSRIRMQKKQEEKRGEKSTHENRRDISKASLPDSGKEEGKEEI